MATAVIAQRAINALARVLCHPAILRWAAPIRTLRQLRGRRPARIPITEARRILVIRPDEIGDVVLTSPFLRELRRAAPRARITLVVKIACRELVERCPYVDAVHALNFAAGGNWYRIQLCLAAWLLRLRRLAWQGFDLVLLPRRGRDWYDSELVGHLLAGRGALLVHRELLTENPSHKSIDIPIALECYSNPQIEHEVLHNLRFLRWCGATDATESDLEFWLTKSDDNFALSLLNTSHGFVAFAPGARDSLKRWPVDHFAAIAVWLRDQHGLVPVLLGAPGDPDFGGALNLIGRTTLGQAAAVLKGCELCVGNDSGLKHIAAAVGVPILEINGFRAGGEPSHPNSPSRFHAWDVPQRIVQPSAGAGDLAIKEVTTDAVRLACTELLTACRGRLKETAAAD